MKTKDFFMDNENNARIKATAMLLAVVFVIGLVTGRYGTQVGWYYVLAVFGSFAAISTGLLYHYREHEDEE